MINRQAQKLTPGDEVGIRARGKDSGGLVYGIIKFVYEPERPQSLCFDILTHEGVWLTKVSYLDII